MSAIKYSCVVLQDVTHQIQLCSITRCQPSNTAV